MKPARYWFVPGVACLIWLLQFLRNTMTPAGSAILSFDGDVALHILLGDLMRERGWFLETEPTNYLMEGLEFIAHEWLPEVVMSFSHSLFGPAGPVLLASIVLATLSAQMFRRMVAEGTGAWPAVITLIGAFMVMNGHLHPRPHVLTWWFTFLLLGWLEDHRRGDLDTQGWLLRSGALMLLWAQCHGGFLATAPILGAYGLGALLSAPSDPSPHPALHRLKTWFLGGLLLLAISGINPWGFALHAHFLEWLSNPYMTSFTNEFDSPDFKTQAGYFLAFYFTLIAMALALPRERPTAERFILVLVLVFMTLQSARHGALMAVLTAPWVAHRLQLAITELAQSSSPLGKVFAEVEASSKRLVDGEQDNGGWGTAAIIAVVVTLAVGVARTPRIDFEPTMQPVEAVQWVKDHPEATRGRMFNPFRWGAYIAYSLYPTHRTFINSWHDHLGEKALRRYFIVHDVFPKWGAVLDKYEVDWILYETRSELAFILDADEGWTRVYQDPTASIWVRADTE